MTTAACREIPASVLHELLRLDPDTGFLYWKYRSNGSKSWNNRFVGKPALTALNGKGYFHGMIFSKPVRAHQVVFAITHGRWPNGQVDHHNGDIRDNRPANLREVDRVSNTNMFTRKPLLSPMMSVAGTTKGVTQFHLRHFIFRGNVTAQA